MYVVRGGARGLWNDMMGFVIFVCFHVTRIDLWMLGCLLTQNNQVWNVAKNAAAAAAISLGLSGSPAVLAKEPNAFPKFPDNGAGEAVSTVSNLS